MDKEIEGINEEDEGDAETFSIEREVQTDRQTDNYRAGWGLLLSRMLPSYLLARIDTLVGIVYPSLPSQLTDFFSMNCQLLHR